MTDVTPAPLPEQIAPGVWALSAAPVPWRGVPVQLRATLVRLQGGDLWLHAPCPLDQGLAGAVAECGRLAHIVRPPVPHLPHLADWQAAFPGAAIWDAGAADGAPWADEITPVSARGAQCETAFLHHATRSVILSRLVMAITTAGLPVWARPLIWLAGIDDSDGKPPPGLARRVGGRAALGDLVERILDWGPERLILTHGRCYGIDAPGELHRAYRRLMRDRLWERVLSDPGNRR